MRNFHFHNSRPKWDGGLYEGDEHVRTEALYLAKELGADYIEFELKVYALKLLCHDNL